MGVSLERDRDFYSDSHGHTNIPYEIMQEMSDPTAPLDVSAKLFLGEAAPALPAPGDHQKVLKYRGPMEREEDALRVAAICCGSKVLPPAPPSMEKCKAQAMEMQEEYTDRY